MSPHSSSRDPERRIVRRERPVSGPVEDYESPDEDLDPEGPSREDISRFDDVTVKCPECGTELFDDVALCWKCGRPVGPGAPKDAKFPLVTVIVVVLVIAAFLVAFRFF